MNKLNKPESRVQRNIRIVMSNIKEEQQQKVVKYFSHLKQDAELAKPRYAHSQFPQQKFYQTVAEPSLIDFSLENLNLKVSRVGTLVEPMIPIEEIPHKPIIKKFKVLKHPVFLTENTINKIEPTERHNELPTSIKRSTKQQMMNNEILHRLGLLSVQAKRELQIEKLSNRALKVSKSKEIPSKVHKQLEAITQQLKENEKPELIQLTQRCTTSASGASRKAYDYQDEYLVDCLTERLNLVYSVSTFKNRPQTRLAKRKIHNFFKTVTMAHLENLDEIKKDDQSIQIQIKSIKEKLQLCKRRLLDYNDEIEIALTEDIKGQVIEYKNIIKNNKK
ncbi:unnamed protein product (macronuclear) [Paramecium tetraurelia]|uniref:IQ calmodulin-binding motif family protein n=1 Tax=Paramecium tetraurelia TaxID=5888 RepID=A0BSG3_PARTE|nr:uncharacterized protein GSPATT00031712001 [Paramecium tetraurelia]CAK61480.1 unnamed protein product [Paramecium tetraurelia]|eukprot:XP_001428878.1 hypothetical protein (macronuclear) [Paramecium tetraurelia strain d4-2]